MKILAIHTSSTNCSVCLLQNNTVVQELHRTNEKTHSQQLMPLINQLLTQFHLELSDIDLFACDIGPGSFTGVRIGVSTMQAFIDVTHKKVVGVSSLQGLAYNVLDSQASQNVQYICSLIDAKNDNVYFGLFKKEQNGILQNLEDLSCRNIHDVITLLSEKYGNKKIYFVGDGATSHRYAILENLDKTEFVAESLNIQSSMNIGKIAYYLYQENPNIEYPLHPLYLRKSQAERALDGEK